MRKLQGLPIKVPSVLRDAVRYYLRARACARGAHKPHPHSAHVDVFFVPMVDLCAPDVFFRLFSASDQTADRDRRCSCVPGIPLGSIDNVS